MIINIEIPDGWGIRIWPRHMGELGFMVELRYHLSHRDWTYVDISTAENAEGLQAAVNDCVAKMQSAMREAGDLI